MSPERVQELLEHLHAERSRWIATTDIPAAYIIGAVTGIDRAIAILEKHLAKEEP